MNSRSKNKSKNKTRKAHKYKKQVGGACSTPEQRDKEKETIIKILENLASIPTYVFDNQDYSTFKLTVIPKGTVFYFRSQKQLDKISNHPLWLDYTQSIGKESYLHWPPHILREGLPAVGNPIPPASLSSANNSNTYTSVLEFNKENQQQNPPLNPKTKTKKDILAHFARKVIGLYGPYLNTVKTNADVLCLHFPLNPLSPNADQSYTSECEEMIKTITGAAHYWDLQMTVQAYTLDFFPGSDAAYKDEIPAPYGYRELAIQNQFLSFIASEYSPLPPEVAYTKQEYQVMRNFKDSVIRQRSNYKDAKLSYLTRVAKGEANTKGVRENNKAILKFIKNSL